MTGLTRRTGAPYSTFGMARGVMGSMSPMSGRSERDEAFTAFVAAHGHALRRYAYVLVGEPAGADDLLQTGLERLYLAWDNVAAEEARLAYASRIMARARVSWWRRAARREAPMADPPEPTGPYAGMYAGMSAGPGPDPSGAIADRDEVWRLLATLPPRTRAVLVLRYYEDLPEADIAAVLGCSVGSVKSQLSRGLARLRVDRIPSTEVTA